MSNPSTGDIQHGAKLNERRRFQQLTGKRPVRYRPSPGIPLSAHFGRSERDCDGEKADICLTTAGRMG